MSEKFYVGRDLVDFADNGQRRPISRVTLMLDDETCYTAGDDTGAEFIANCVFATQAMANNMLATLKGYVHKAFNAEAANIDPAAELGDGVTAMGIYSVFSEISDDGYGYPNIQASGERILEEEYNNGSPLQISINRKVAKAKAELRVDIDSITARVEGEGGLADQFTELKVTLDGVTVTDSSGTTLIKGSSIETDSLNLTGKITFGDLSSSVQNDINDAWSMAYSAQSLASDVDDVVSAWSYGGTTYIDGNMLMTNTVRASTLEGGSVALLNSSGGTVGTLTMTGASTASYAVALNSYGALRLMADAGAVYAESGYGTYLQLTDTITAGYGDFKSNADGVYSCGSASYKWSEVYADTETITTSDRNKKNSIDYDLTAYDAFFDSLKPASFKFNNGTSDRTHIGMIAQDVETSLADNGLTSLDFAGFVTYEDEESGETGYALRYGEFISLCIDQIQRLKARVSELEDRI